MISNLLTKTKYFHLKLVHEHPTGIHNRFEKTADKWIETLRHPHIKTYYDFFKNIQTKQHALELRQSQKEQLFEKQVDTSLQPGFADLKEFSKFFFTKRVDDYELTRDISDMTITKFIQEGRQNLTDVHKLILTGGLLIVVHVILYFVFVHQKQLVPKTERVKVLNAEFLEKYHFNFEQQRYKKIKDRIKIVNEEYEKQLKQSKLC